MTTTVLSAQQFLNEILTTEHIEVPADSTHTDGWLTSKKNDAANPNNPFKGYGPTRTRVSDLSPDQLSELEITKTADNEGMDVYHPLFMEFNELDEDTKGKNVIPLAVLCYTLGDFILSPDDSLDSLNNALTGIISGTDQNSVTLVMKINHAMFQASEIRIGNRGYGENARADFPLFRSLHGDVAELDKWSILPAAKWLQTEVSKKLDL